MCGAHLRGGVGERLRYDGKVGCEGFFKCLCLLFRLRLLRCECCEVILLFRRGGLDGRQSNRLLTRDDLCQVRERFLRLLNLLLRRLCLREFLSNLLHGFLKILRRLRRLLLSLLCVVCLQRLIALLRIGGCGLH